MNIRLKNLLLIPAFFCLSAQALILPKIETGTKIVYKGRTYCGTSRIGHQKTVSRLTEVRADGSFDLKSIESGLTNFGAWSIKYLESVDAKKRQILEALLEGTNCSKVGGVLADLTLGEELLKACIITNESDTSIARYYLVQGFALPVKTEIFIKPPTMCDDYRGYVELVQ